MITLISKEFIKHQDLSLWVTPTGVNSPAYWPWSTSPTSSATVTASLKVPLLLCATIKLPSKPSTMVYPGPIVDSFDLINSLRHALALSPLNWTTQHVYSHWDCSGQPLTHLEQLNVQIDTLANEYQCTCERLAQPSPKLPLTMNTGVYGIFKPKSHPPHIATYTSLSPNLPFALTGHNPTIYNIFLASPLKHLMILIGTQLLPSCVQSLLENDDGAQSMLPSNVE